jgi:hypothetical protein
LKSQPGCHQPDVLMSDERVEQIGVRLAQFATIDLSGV